MKKMLSALLSALVVLSLAACGGEQPEPPGEQTPDNQPQVEQPAPQPEVEEPEAPVVWTLDTVPVPEEMKEFVSNQGDDFVDYTVFNVVGYDVLTAYEALLAEKGFTITQTTLETRRHQSVATQNNAKVKLHYEVVDGTLMDPKQRAGFADTSVFQINIEVEPVEEPETPVVWTLDTVPRPPVEPGERYDESMTESDAMYDFQNMTKELAEQKFNDYQAALEAAGFHVEKTEPEIGREDELCRLKAESGNAWVNVSKFKIKSDVYNMSVTIVVEEVEAVEEPEAPQAPQGTQMPVDLPEGNWTSDDHNSGQFCFHKNTSYDLTLEDAQNYVETLKNDSYWFDFEVTDGEEDGEIYFFSAFGEDPKLNRVTVSVRETGDPEKPLMTMVTFREIVD